nr:class I SAM-dependent methyltransferase [uncultured Rhodopila sp.]
MPAALVPLTLSELGAQCDEASWLEALKEASLGPVVRGVRFPSPPEPRWQSNFVGMSGVTALEDAFVFYRFVKSEYERLCEASVRSDTRVLDFGSGWGRYLLFFMKDVSAHNLFGVDVDPDVIGFCKVSGLPAQLTTVPAYGPTAFASGSLDLIYSYSVFSHLAEPAHLAWIHEFRRILRPGGIVVLTTQGRHFIQQVKSLIGKSIDELGPWERSLVAGFKDPDASIASYDRGEFVYAASGGGDHRPATFYGEALVPKQYIERSYPPDLELKAFISDPSKFAQAVAVLQRC